VRSEAECSSTVVTLGGGAKRSRVSVAGKAAADVNSLVASTSDLLNICGGSGYKPEKPLAVNVGLPIGRPLGKGNGWGTGWLLDTAGDDRFPCVKLLLKHTRGRHRAAAIRSYEAQLAGMLPRIHRRDGCSLPTKPIG